MAIALPETARTSLALLGEAGAEAWCVGGFVRDQIMGRRGNDIDIATDFLWQQVQEVFEAAGFSTHETGTAHGTITVIVDGSAVEITTFRLDGSYSDGRHPDSVEFALSLEEDLKRRDFTMNALAYHPDRGLVDLYGGLADIEAGIIRTVGDPMARFKEDALRILRGCRFASQLGFSIEPETLSAMKASKSLLRKVSGERIYQELESMLCGKHIHDALMGTVDVLAFVLPELVAMKDCVQDTPYHIYDVLEHTAYVVSHVNPEPLVRWVALFHDMGKPAAAFYEGDLEHFYGHGFVSEALARGIMERLPFPKRIKADAPLLVRIHDDVIPAEPRPVRRALRRLDGRVDLFRALCDIKRADALSQAPHCVGRVELAAELEWTLDELIAEEAAFSVKQLAVNGHDLMALGVKPGPLMGQLLDDALDAVIDDKIANERNDLLDYLSQTLNASRQ